LLGQRGKYCLDDLAEEIEIINEFLRKTGFPPFSMSPIKIEKSVLDNP